MINNYKFHKVDYSHQSVHCLSNQMTDNPHRTLTLGPTWSISARSTWPNHLAGRRGRPCSLNLKSPRVQMRKKERRGGGNRGREADKGTEREREKKSERRKGERWERGETEKEKGEKEERNQPNPDAAASPTDFNPTDYNPSRRSVSRSLQTTQRQRPLQTTT